MKTLGKLTLVGALAALAGGCVSQTDFDTHVAAYTALQQDHATLKSELQTWANGVRDWQQLTYSVVCDVVAKNGPPSKYSAPTVQYCPAGGTDGNGKPNDPPVFGE